MKGGDNFMYVKTYYRILTIGLFVINIVFWLAIFGNFSFVEYANDDAYLILKILLFGEPVAFAVGLWGYVKKIKGLYLVTILFLIVNSILSLTDQAGLLDLISLLLSLVLLIVMVVQWESMMKHPKF